MNKDSISHKTGESTSGAMDICASEGCGKPAAVNFIRADVGSYYCADCYSRIHAAETERLAALASQHAVDGEAVAWGMFSSSAGCLSTTTEEQVAKRWAAESSQGISVKALYARPAADDAGVREALRNVIMAWEATKPGNTTTREIQRWLVEDMKPAVDAARAALSLAAKRGQAR